MLADKSHCMPIRFDVKYDSVANTDKCEILIAFSLIFLRGLGYFERLLGLPQLQASLSSFTDFLCQCLAVLYMNHSTSVFCFRYNVVKKQIFLFLHCEPPGVSLAFSDLSQTCFVVKFWEGFQQGPEGCHGVVFSQFCPLGNHFNSPCPVLVLAHGSPLWQLFKNQH